MQDNGYFYIGKAAKLIGIHKNTLQRWIKERKLEKFIGRIKKDLRGWKVFSQEDIEKIKNYSQNIT
ncbi:hypothetical protein ES705_26735 [subsurface metagenome]